MRPLIVIGTRPEAVKLAPVALAMPGSVILATGQHDITEQLADFNLEADISAHVGSVLSDHIASVLSSIHSVRPSMVVVQGDTDSTLAGAIAGYQAGVPVAHVEAGLRTDDRRSPWPEEGWRRCISQLADHHFAPTRAAYDRLIAERVDGSVHLSGNTVIDALRLSGVARTAPATDILVELHRRESIGEPMRRVLAGVRALAADYRVTVVAHRNPAVRSIVRDIFPESIEPVGYLEFVRMLAASRIVVTDSGGICEEASWLGVPALITRDTTERRESVDAGASLLVGDHVEDAARLVLGNSRVYERMSGAACPFGDGHAAELIARVLESQV